MIRSQDDIANFLIDHYSNKFAKSDVELNDDMLSLIPNVITNDENEMLSKIPDAEEIKHAVFTLNALSALGPDGYNGFFF
ncbi:hypothetical protein FRX31_013031, partial [Thalictrum thalictroides]